MCRLSFYLLLLIVSLVSFGHCVVCPSTYSFLLPLWYLLVIVLSVLLRLTPSYCLFGIFWSLCCLSFYLLLLIASLVSFGHCVVCPSTYSFLLPLWYLLVIVLSVLLLTPSYCLFGIFWSLCCLSFFDLLLLIASLVSFGHCVVCPSLLLLIASLVLTPFLLPLWYLLVIVSSVLLLTPSYCLFGIFWSLCCLSFFYLLLLIASLVSFGHCVVCPSTYSFLLPLWYLLVIVLSVLLLTPSYCLFGIFWSLCCLSFFYLLLLIASLVSFGHCVVCPSTYSFLLPLWYLLVIVLSVLLLLTPSYCLFGIFWSLCCLSFFYLLLLIASFGLVSFGHCVVCPSTYSFLLPYLLVIVLSVLLLTPSLVSFGHCVVCPSSTYSFLLSLWYLLVIVLSVLLLLTPSYWVSFGHCVVCPSTYSFLLSLWYLLVIVLSVLLLLTPSYCLFGIFWSLCRLSFYLLLLIASLVSFGHCVVCPSTYSFLLSLWYLLVIVLSVLLLLTPSYCLFGIFWSLCRLSFYLLLLIASLVSFGHCVVCPSTYSFLLPLWYLLVIVLSVLLLLTPSYCLFGIFWSLCCLSFFYLLLLIASLVSFGHCVVCPSSTYSFLLPLWYLLVIVSSVLLLTPSYCLFGIFWSLCCLSFFYLLLLIASLVSFGHCVVCPSTYSFLLSLWYLLVIVLSVLLLLTPSYCLFGIFWSLCCLSFFYLLLLIAPLVSFGHCVVCPSSTYSFLLPLWYLLVIVLSVLLLLTPSYCLFGIFWSLCCLSFFYLLLLIASLVSFGHCVVCPSTYSFLLSLWYLLVIVLSILLLLTPSYCLFGIFWSLCRLSFFDLLLLIAPLVFFGHCVVCPSTYSFLLPRWYLLVIVLSVLL